MSTTIFVSLMIVSDHLHLAQRPVSPGPVAAPLSCESFSSKDSIQHYRVRVNGISYYIFVEPYRQLR